MLDWGPRFLHQEPVILSRVLKSYIDLWPLYVQFIPPSSGISNLSPSQTWAKTCPTGTLGWVGGWLGKVSTSTGVCMLGGASQTPYWWAWEEVPPASGQPRYFSFQDAPVITEILRDQASSGKWGWVCGTSVLNLLSVNHLWCSTHTTPFFLSPSTRTHSYSCCSLEYPASSSYANLLSWEILHLTQTDQALARVQGCSSTHQLPPKYIFLAHFL